MLLKLVKHFIIFLKQPEHSAFYGFLPVYFIFTKFRTIKNSLKKPPVNIIFKEPKLLNSKDVNENILALNLSSYAGRTPVIPEVHLYELDDAIICPKWGTIIDKEGFIILESHKTLDDVNNRSLLGKLKISSRKIKKLSGTYTTIYTEMGGGYGHFVIDHLPRLYALQFYRGEITILMPDTLMPVLKKLVDWVKPANCKVEYVNPNHNFQCSKVLLSPFTTIGGFGYHRPEIASYIRACVKDKFAPLNTKWAGIYVTRRKAKYGNIIDEDKLILELEKRNIKAVDLEDLSIEEQMSYFAHTPLICGSQGSGFANLVFANKATVIQILWKRETIPTIGLYDYGLSLAYGHHYIPLVQKHNGLLKDPLDLEIKEFIELIDKYINSKL